MLLTIEALFAKSAPGGCVAFEGVGRVFAAFMSWVTLNVLMGQDDMKTFEDVRRAAQSFNELKLTVEPCGNTDDDDDDGGQPSAGDAPAVKKRKTRDGSKPRSSTAKEWREVMGDAFEVDSWDESCEEEGCQITDWRSAKLWPDLKESYVMYELIMTTDRRLAVKVERHVNDGERVVCYQ